jgi:hypothetical protein
MVKYRLRIVILIFILLFFYPQLVLAVRIAILEFEDLSSPPSLDGQDSIRELFENTLSEEFDIVARETVDKILTAESLKSIGEITQQKAYVLGRVLDADVLVVGDFVQHDTSFVINASFISTGRIELTGVKHKIIKLFLSRYELRGKVKNVNKREVYVNIGELVGIKLGDKLDVFRDDTKIGMLHVVEIHPRELLGILVKGKEIQIGDKVKKQPVTWGKDTRSIIITANPSPARITIDNKAIGYTPLVFNTDYEKFNIKISKLDYHTYEKVVNIFNPSYSFLNLSLILVSLHEKPKEILISGSMLITSLPSGAYVYLDGVLRGTTPLLVTDLPPKKYVLKLVKPGFSTRKKRVIVRSGKETKVNIYLHKAIPPRRPPEPPLELLSIQTLNLLKPGECFIAVRYPEWFILKLGLPVSGMELRIAGLGIGLKHQLTDKLSLDMYYNFYDARKNEKNINKGVSLITEYPLKTRFFEGESYIGGGYYSEDKYRWFAGVEIPIIIGVYNFIAEFDTVEGWAVGIKEIFKNRVEVVVGIGKDTSGKIRYDFTLSYKSK